jgi:hypothetical protein
VNLNCDLLVSTSQVAEIIGVNHHTQARIDFFVSGTGLALNLKTFVVNNM